MLTYLDSFLSDPVGVLVIFLLAFPGRILALSAHEYAHAWVADRCGDHTARQLGRLTLNPFAHLDPLGAILMILVGFGWAKPVPVNPLNYRNYRKDDLKVSLAGVTMNLMLFALSMLAMFGIVAATLKRIPYGGLNDLGGAAFRAPYMNQDCLFFLQILCLFLRLNCSYLSPAGLIFRQEGLKLILCFLRFYTIELRFKVIHLILYLRHVLRQEQLLEFFNNFLSCACHKYIYIIFALQRYNFFLIYTKKNTEKFVYMHFL